MESHHRIPSSILWGNSSLTLLTPRIFFKSVPWTCACVWCICTVCSWVCVCDLIQKCVDVKFITNLILSSPPSFWVCSLIIQLLQYCNGKVSNFGINYIGQYESGINIAITCLLFPLIAYLSCVYVILNIRHEIYKLWTSFILDDKIQLFEIR